MAIPALAPKPLAESGQTLPPLELAIRAVGLAFGPYDVFAAAATKVNGTLNITCSLDAADQGAQKLVPYVVSLSTGSSNSFVQRTMKSGTNALGYNIYTSNAYSNVWGDGTG